MLSFSSCTSSFHFKAILATSFRRCNSYMRFVYLFLSFHAVHFVTSFLSLQHFFPVRLALPFNSSISLPPSFRCNLSLPFVTPFRFNTSLPFVCLFLSLQVVHFISSFLLFQLVHPVSWQTWKTRVAASGCAWLCFEFQLPRVLQQCYSF